MGSLYRAYLSGIFLYRMLYQVGAVFVQNFL